MKWWHEQGWSPALAEYSLLKAGWLERPKCNSVFKSFQIFFGLFPLVKKQEILQKHARR